MNPSNPYAPDGQPQPTVPGQPFPGQGMPQPVQPQGMGIPGVPPQGVPGMVPVAAGQPLGHNDASRKKSPLTLIVIITLTMLLLGAAGFGVWAFMERQDYKNNSDQKVAVAVEEAKKITTEENNLRFAEESKNPLKTYKGPSALGSVSIMYPKTWSGVVDVSGVRNAPLLAKFHPDFVPSVQSSNGAPALALTVSVLNEPYDRVIEERSGAVENGELRAEPYALPKMEEQIGVKFVGKVNQNYNGTEIVVPLRDKTLVILTETDQYLDDFNTYILPNITFVP